MVDFQVEDKRIYQIKDRIGPDNAKGKAEELKTKAFGLVSNLIFGAKAQDIELKYLERRYEPFWHIICTTRLEYDRSRQYKIGVEAVVKTVTIDGKDYPANERILLDGVEHCVENLRKEVFIDAVTGKSGDYANYVKCEKEEISRTEELAAGDTIVVPAKVKASYLTRSMLADMLKPIEAHEITREEIRIEALHLYFRPIYAFEYLWVAKNKAATLELDAATLQAKPGGKTVKEKMAEIIKEADLFDIGTDVANLVVPGGGLAMKLAKRAIKKK